MNAGSGSRALLDVTRVFGPESAALERKRRQPRELLIATFARLEIRSSYCKQIAYQFSNRNKNGVFAKPPFRGLSLHERQAVRYQVRKHVGIEHDDDADDRAERDRVPENVTEDDALIADLLSGGGGDGDG